MISESRKAIAAFVVAFLGPLGVLLAATDQPLDWRAISAATISGVVAGFTTWLVPNAAKSVPPSV